MIRPAFAEPVTKDDIVWAYSAVRPLYDDGASKAQEATRDYVLKLEQNTGEPPLLNVFGGKLTTYRRLAEHALEKINEAIGNSGAYDAAIRIPYWGSRSELIEVLELARAGKIDVEVQPYSLDDGAQAYEDLAANTIRGRAVIVP